MSQSESFDDSHAITLGGTAPGASSRQLKPGDLIGGTYRLKLLLARGGMGYVFQAEHKMIGRDYALKMLDPEQLNENSRRRFVIEGRSIAKLDHPAIVKVYNMGLDAGDFPFYVMDLLDGMTLSHYIKKSQTISFEECIDIFRQIAEGLNYAHGKGIVHRDVKPSNIMLEIKKGGWPAVKIVDFGIAKLVESTSLQGQSQTAAGVIFGSPLYMSPEQSLGDMVDLRTDIYSLGCALFETLAAVPPFRGESAMETLMMHQNQPVPSVAAVSGRTDLPADIDFMIGKMMAKRPDQRYQTMAQVRHDLERLEKGRLIGKAAAESTPFDADGGASSALADGKGPGRGSILLAWAGMAVVGSIAFATIFHIFLQQTPRQSQTEKLGAHGKEASSAVVPAVSFTAPAAPKLNPAEGQSDPAFLVDPDEVRVIDDPNRQQASKCFAAVTAIRSTMIMKNGVKMRRFNFPAWPIGRVSYQGGDAIEACGEQFFPADKELELRIGFGKSREVFYFPEVVAKIGGNEFAKVCLSGVKMTDLTANLLGKESQTIGIVRILKICASWSGLYRLKLDALSASNEVLKEINNLPHLKTMELSNIIFARKDLYSQPFLNRLSSFAVEKLENQGELDESILLCERLAQCPRLLTVGLTNCHTSPLALAELDKSKSLHTLILHEKQMAPLVEKMANFKTIANLWFPFITLSDAELAKLLTNFNIHRIYLTKSIYKNGEEKRFPFSNSRVVFQ